MYILLFDIQTFELIIPVTGKPTIYSHPGRARFPDFKLSCNAKWTSFSLFLDELCYIMNVKIYLISGRVLLSKILGNLGYFVISIFLWVGLESLESPPGYVPDSDVTLTSVTSTLIRF